MTLSDLVQEYRREHGLSQRQFASICGLSNGYISMLERNVNPKTGQPFVGGWTEVDAPDGHAACAAFRAYHPDKTEGLLNCSSVYDEAHFKLTEMYRRDNFGFRCHELIQITRTGVPR